MSRKTKSKKNKELKRLHKINESERKRLGASSVVNTRCFKQRQKFGAASGVTQINPKDISPEELQRLVSL